METQPETRKQYLWIEANREWLIECNLYKLPPRTEEEADIMLRLLIHNCRQIERPSVPGERGKAPSGKREKRRGRMLKVTESAKRVLKKILSAKVDNPQAVLRLTASKPDKLALGIDIEMLGDQVVEYEGSKVLVVEQGLATRLKGVTLDVEDTPDGPKLSVLRE